MVEPFLIVVAFGAAALALWYGWNQRALAQQRLAEARQRQSTSANIQLDVDRLIRNLVEAIPRPVLVTTADRVILDANLAALDLVAQSRERVLGRVLAVVIQDYETTQLLINAAESGVAQEHTITRMLNNETWHVTVKPLSLRGDQKKISHLLLFIDDETRLRYLETVRRDFVASVSHELRTPLASVKLLAETLVDIVTTDPQAAREMGGRITLEVDHLTSLVDDLLDLSRIESNRLSFELEPTDIGGVLEVAAERMHQLAEDQRITIVTEIPFELPEAQADGERVSQVLINLIHNAIKFTPACGTITLSAELSTIRAVQKTIGADRIFTAPTMTESDEPVIVVRVRDTGIGIVAEDLPRIFERFFKAKDLEMRGPAPRDATQRPGHHGGTGLGLAIARHIVEAQHGMIWAESQLGRGSTFAFSLPLAAQSTQREPLQRKV